MLLEYLQSHKTYQDWQPEVLCRWAPRLEEA